jgi:ABC-type branched-subunit amino acid transport system ATPase component
LVVAAALSVRALDVAYHRVQVLFGVDLDVPAGSVCALLGTNGAGKSTILRAASGLLRPDRGTVTLFGNDITFVRPECRVGLGMVMVAGGRATFPSLTVEESLRVGAWPFRHDRARVGQAVDAALNRFPLLAERRTQRAGTLSGGEQQLLALARALVPGPQVLLADELTHGLAPAAAADVLATIARLTGEGVAVLLVEQSVRRALAVADTAYFLERGQVRFAGPAADLPARVDLLRPILLAGHDPGV